MVSMQIAALLVAISSGGETVLLDFQAPWCAPCRSMDGTMAELKRAGYPIREVNIDREKALAVQYKVDSIPCFVLLVDGKEAGRITGATRRSELLALFANRRVAPKESANTIARAQSPDPPAVVVPAKILRDPLAARRGGAAAPVEVAGAALLATTPPARATADANQLIAASVRLAIADAKGCSYGTGTIVDARLGDALVLTCGHIFREYSEGKGTITVELCDPRAPQKLTGRLLTFDLKCDLALVTIHAAGAVGVAPVAPRSFAIAKGDRVVTVGCNNGGPPTAVDSTITGVNKFLGPPNLQVAGLPVQGRSGGGLFSADGRVIGVCNAADPTDNEGLYAALAAIQDQLDQVGLTPIYEAPQPAPAVAAARPPSVPSKMPRPSFVSRPDPRILPSVEGHAGPLSDAERSLLAAVNDRTAGAEVICIVRPLADPTARSEVIKLDRASSAFLRQLAADQEAQESRHLTSLEVQRDSRLPSVTRR